MIHYLLVALLSFLFGLISKYADLMNEHGLPEPFRGGRLISGFLWGAAGILMCLLSPFTAITYIAHILYWFQKIKLEYPNHAWAGTSILFCGYFLLGAFLFEHRIELFFLYFAYTLTGMIQSTCRKKFPKTIPFWRLRIRIYLIPLIYSIWSQDPDPFLATLIGMIGTEWLSIKYRHLNSLQKRYELDVQTSRKTAFESKCTLYPSKLKSIDAFIHS